MLCPNLPSPPPRACTYITAVTFQTEFTRALSDDEDRRTHDSFCFPKQKPRVPAPVRRAQRYTVTFQMHIGTPVVVNRERRICEPNRKSRKNTCLPFGRPNVSAYCSTRRTEGRVADRQGEHCWFPISSQYGYHRRKDFPPDETKLCSWFCNFTRLSNAFFFIFIISTKVLLRLHCHLDSVLMIHIKSFYTAMGGMVTT